MTDTENGALHGLICRAGAFEAKWAERDSNGKPVEETVPIMNVGMLKGNRGGVYTQGLACCILNLVQAHGGMVQPPSWVDPVEWWG